MKILRMHFSSKLEHVGVFRCVARVLLSLYSVASSDSISVIIYEHMYYQEYINNTLGITPSLAW